MDKEKRVWDFEFRVIKEDGRQKVAGMAAVFDKLSENLGGFREKIDRGAFDEVLSDDVRALINHNPDWILGRTKSGTLRLKVIDEGLSYEYDDPDTSYSRDLLKSLERGDVSQSSFAFQVEDDKWEEDPDGRMIRTIKKFKRLYDVSPVTYPAYPDTTVAKRSMDELEKIKAEKEAEEAKKRQAEADLAYMDKSLSDIEISRLTALSDK